MTLSTWPTFFCIFPATFSAVPSSSRSGLFVQSRFVERYGIDHSTNLNLFVARSCALSQQNIAADDFDRNDKAFHGV
jgi:hypothetical protein